MKKAIAVGLLFFLICYCAEKKPVATNHNSVEKIKQDTVRIANDSLQYELIIFEPGFHAWLSTQKPRGYYSLLFLEIRNIRFVTEWNNRVMQPYRYDPNLYDMRIEYSSTIHYGYEVNYLLYHYFLYFQSRNKQRL